MSPQQSLRKAKRIAARAGLFGGEADCRALNYEDGAVPYWDFAYVASSAGNRNTRSFGKYRSAIRDYTGGSRLVPAAVLNLVDEAGEHIYIYGVLEGDAGERDVEQTALKRTGGPVTAEPEHYTDALPCAGSRSRCTGRRSGLASSRSRCAVGRSSLAGSLAYAYDLHWEITIGVGQADFGISLQIGCEHAGDIAHSMELGSLVLGLTLEIGADKTIRLLHPSVIEVHHSEHGRRTTQRKVNQHMTQVVFGLAVLGPFYVVEGVAILKLGRTTGFTLEHLDGRIKFGTQALKFLDTLDNALRHRPIGVIGHIVYIFQTAQTLDFVEGICKVAVAEGIGCKSRNLRIGILLAYNLGRTDEKVGIFSPTLALDTIGGFCSIGLIPDLIHSYLAFVAAHSLAHIFQPGIHNGTIGENTGIQVVPGIAVNGIAIAEAEPGMYALFE